MSFRHVFMIWYVLAKERGDFRDRLQRARGTMVGFPGGSSVLSTRQTNLPFPAGAVSHTGHELSRIYHQLNGR